MGCATLRLRWIAAPAVAVAAAASPARAATPGAAALDNRREAVVWTGHVTRGAEPSNAVPECSLTACDEFELRLDLSSGTFNRRRGGVEVSMRWFSTFGDNLRLYVYRHGALVAKSDGIIASAQSDGIIASAQSVLIPSPADGRYTVYAAFDPDSFGDGVSYEGLAQVEYAPRAEPRRPLLPDLIALSQRNITFETPLDFGFEPPPTPGDSCFGSEKDEEGAQFGGRVADAERGVLRAAGGHRAHQPRDRPGPVRLPAGGRDAPELRLPQARDPVAARAQLARPGRW